MVVPAGGSLKAYQFDLDSYGAVGDGVTDDTVAIRTALAAGYNYATGTGTPGYYQLIFNASKTYLCNGPLSTGTLGITGKCKAILPLPITATTAQKVIHHWTAGLSGGGSPLYHWQQTTPQQAGAVLKTTLNASANFGALGTEPSFIGGGIPANGYGAATSVFGNDLFLLDGINLQLPQNPQICGIDLRGVAAAQIFRGSVLPNVGSGLISAITFPTNGQQFGLYMPQVNNNDLADIFSFTTEGQNYGMVLSEHTTVHSARSAYNLGGYVLTGGNASGTAHGIRCHYLSAEANQIHTQFNYDSASPVKVVIDMLDVETGSGSFATDWMIFDPNNYAVGKIGLMNITAGTPRTATTNASGVMDGGSGLNVRTLDLPYGHITAPSVPATTTPLQNASGADAAVTVSANGATISAILVDGTATGQIAGTVVVPNGKTIQLNYTVATPTWVWNLLAP